ncbi:MAG: flagellar motor switch protein FliN [Hyphomicrobiales bacterium]
MSDEPGNNDIIADGDDTGIDLVEHSAPLKSSDDNITETKDPADLQTIFDAPVKVSAVLGRTKLKVSDLISMGRGTILELDRKVGESIDIFVNNRLIARGEVVLVDNQLGVTMTEIIAQE